MHVIKVLTGDTKLFRGEITAYDGVTLADPTGNIVTVKIYAGDTNNLILTDTATRVSTGVYDYEYTFGDTERSYLVEFSGTFDGYVHLGRTKVRARMRT
jgi:hypothetical protein